MALQQARTFKGVDLPKSYIRCISATVDWQGQQAHFAFALYADKQARDEEATTWLEAIHLSIGAEAIGEVPAFADEFGAETVNLRKAAYLLAKKVLFKEAEDVLEKDKRIEAA